MTDMLKLLKIVDKVEKPVMINEAVSLNISANGDCADDITAILGKLVNLSNPSTSTQDMTPHGGHKDTMMSTIANVGDYADQAAHEYAGEVGEEYANEPHPEVSDVEYMTKDLAGGLNKPKAQFKKEYPGDNPMSMEEARAAELMAEYKSLIEHSVNELSPDTRNAYIRKADKQVTRTNTMGVAKRTGGVGMDDASRKMANRKAGIKRAMGTEQIEDEGIGSAAWALTKGAVKVPAKAVGNLAGGAAKGVLRGAGSLGKGIVKGAIKAAPAVVKGVGGAVGNVAMGAVRGIGKAGSGMSKDIKQVGRDVKTAYRKEGRVDELSPKTMGSYVNKAVTDLAVNARMAAGKPTSSEENKTATKRAAGIKRAADKLSREATDPRDSLPQTWRPNNTGYAWDKLATRMTSDPKDSKARKAGKQSGLKHSIKGALGSHGPKGHLPEDQVKEVGDTEAGKKALGSYVNKSAASLGKAGYKAGSTDGTAAKLDPHIHTINKRSVGIKRATDRLTRESTDKKPTDDAKKKKSEKMKAYRADRDKNGED